MTVMNNKYFYKIAEAFYARLKRMIVGVDEVGRGCLAGPLCVGAVVLGDPIIGLDDSKKLTAKQRARLAAEIRRTALAIGVGWVSARAIDTHGLSAALKAATLQAVSQIKIAFEEIIIDGTVNFIGDPRVTTLAKADSLVPAVSAASIVAKVARDTYMQTVHTKFPVYEFAKHVGYGTKLHRELITAHGPSPLHRMSFAPLHGFVPAAPRAKTSGAKAEDAAALFLQTQGFEIIEQNWRTKWCEIDIVAKKNNTIYFVEVKYRGRTTQGSGLDYITPAKLQQMQFAAKFWVHSNEWSGDCKLAAAEVAGADFIVTAWLDTL